MTDKELKKLSRAQLLELLVDQSREIDRLQAALDEANQRLAKRDLNLSQCGSIAEASLLITEVFERAQDAADLYLKAAKRYVARTIAEGKPLPPLLSDTKEQEGADQ
ncbi:MAG: DNA repair protein [Oscillospiraceae bacterium]|nr:DNA repair protein [Oscillospiraceae bacterium]